MWTWPCHGTSINIQASRTQPENSVSGLLPSNPRQRQRPPPRKAHACQPSSPRTTTDTGLCGPCGPWQQHKRRGQTNKTGSANLAWHKRGYINQMITYCIKRAMWSMDKLEKQEEAILGRGTAMARNPPQLAVRTPNEQTATLNRCLWNSTALRLLTVQFLILLAP